MEHRKVVLGGNPSAQIRPIPDMCVQDRTITLNKMAVLNIFKDRRPTAQAWINDTLPRLILLEETKKQKFVNWFWHEMPNNSWLEFDFGTKLLSLCVLEEKNK